MLSSVANAWRRRWWREDPIALAAYANLRPMTVVTGASEGIGHALARRFAAAGHDVLVIARRAELLEAAAARIRAEHGVLVVAVPIDVTSPEAIAAIESALAHNGAYADILVNNAGIGLAGSFLSHAPEEIGQLLATNVRALTGLMRHFLTGMRVRGRGGILNLASVGSFTPGPYQAVYYASKAYVLSLSEAVAAETAGEGVRITAVAPGPVQTNFHRRMRSERSLYRYLVVPSSPESVAAAAYLGFALGLRLVVPGILNPFMALAVRVLPHRIVVPIVGWLLKPRGTEGSDAGR